MRYEQDAGRILARKTETDTAAMKDRLVMMAVAITQLDSVRCVIDARFNFANERGVYSRHDELIPQHYFTLLFDYLDSVFPKD